MSLRPNRGRFGHQPAAGDVFYDQRRMNDGRQPNGKIHSVRGENVYVRFFEDGPFEMWHQHTYTKTELLGHYEGERWGYQFWVEVPE